jgi:hypothetical protein
MLMYLNRMNASANTGTAALKPFFTLVIFIGVLIGLYYLYNWLYGSQEIQSDVDLVPAGKPLDFSKSTGTNPSIAQYDINGIQDGGQYSMTFWVYISKTSGFTSGNGTIPKLAHFIDISNDRFNTTAASKGKTLIFVGMNPQDGSLIVRQNAADDVGIDNAASKISSISYPLTDLINNYNATNSTYTTDDRCDILNGIEYQRWVMIGVVANSRTLDVYIDGKLARSCVYKAPFGVDASGSPNIKATIGNNEAGKLNGFMSSGKFYNYAVTPDKMWSKYMAGPKGEFSFSSFFNTMFSTEFTVNTSDAPK